MRPFGAEQGHRGAVGEYRANAGFPKRVDGGVGMRRGVDVVVPVEQRGPAGIDSLWRHAAQGGLPEVDVAVDKTRDGDHAAAVDLDHGPTADVPADRNDLTVVNQQVAGLDNAERGVHRDDRCAFNAYPGRHSPSWPLDQIDAIEA